METLTYIVAGMTCRHCEAAVKDEIEAIEGVESVTVELDTKGVEVRGVGLDDAEIRSAIAEAGYAAA